MADAREVGFEAVRSPPSDCPRGLVLRRLIMTWARKHKRHRDLGASDLSGASSLPPLADRRKMVTADVETEPFQRNLAAQVPSLALALLLYPFLPILSTSLNPGPVGMWGTKPGGEGGSPARGCPRVTIQNAIPQPPRGDSGSARIAREVDR